MKMYKFCNDKAIEIYEESSGNALYFSYLTLVALKKDNVTYRTISDFDIISNTTCKHLKEMLSRNKKEYMSLPYMTMEMEIIPTVDGNQIIEKI